MSARIIDGKRVAAGIKDDLSRRVRAVRDAGGLRTKAEVMTLDVDPVSLS